MPNQKAFTLFTALVSFILIILAVLLVYSMVRAERNTTDVLGDIEEQAEMQAIADLTRADALQVFNYGIRYAIEDWTTKDEDPKDGIPENIYLIRPRDSGWGAIKKEFARSNFGIEGKGTQFATRTSKHLSSILAKSEDIRGYDVDLDRPDEALLTQSLQDVFDKSSDMDEFFNVIQCSDGDFDNCLGTFYVNLNLSKEYLSDADYELFPLIRIENRRTRRVLKQPILPRGNLQIYAPLRIFKAIAAGKELAHTPGNMGIYDAPGHGGTFFEEINELQIGYCEPGCGSPIGTDKTTAMNSDALVHLVESMAEDKLNKKLDELISAFALDSNPEFKLKIREIDVLPKVKRTKIFPAASTADDDEVGFCAKVIEIQAKVVFEELNPKYQVIGNKQHLYAIKLFDSRYAPIAIELEECP